MRMGGPDIREPWPPLNVHVRCIKQTGRKDKESGQRPRKRLYFWGRGEETLTDTMGTIHCEVTFVAGTGSLLERISIWSNLNCRYRVIVGKKSHFGVTFIADTGSLLENISLWSNLYCRYRVIVGRILVWSNLYCRYRVMVGKISLWSNFYYRYGVIVGKDLTFK